LTLPILWGCSIGGAGGSEETTQVNSDLLAEILTGNKSRQPNENSVKLDLDESAVEIPAEKEGTREKSSGSLVIDAGPHSEEISAIEVQGSLFDEDVPVEEEIAHEEEAVVDVDEAGVESKSVPEGANELTEVEEKETAQTEEAEVVVEEIPEEGVEINVDELNGDVEPPHSEAEEPAVPEKEGTEKMNMTQVALGKRGRKTTEDSWFSSEEDMEKPRGMGTANVPQRKMRQETVAGMPRADLKADEEVDGKKIGLSTSGLFSEFDKEKSGEAPEGSRPIKLEDVSSESDGVPKKGALDHTPPKRLPTVEMPRIGKELSGMEQTTPEGSAIDPNGATQYASPELSNDTGKRRAKIAQIARKVKEGKASHDFVAYGDVLYEMELAGRVAGVEENVLAKLEDVLDNLGKRPQTAIEFLRGDVEVTIGLLEEIESWLINHENSIKEKSPESKRLEKLRMFKAFVLDKEDAEEKALEYAFWLKGEREKFEQVADAFDILDISPSEHSREAVVKLCENAAKEKLEEIGKRKIADLWDLVKGNEGQEIEADYRYSMLTGYLSRRNRERIVRLEKELEKYGVTADEFDKKKEQMVEVLASVLKVNQEIARTGRSAQELAPIIKEEIMKLAPEDPIGRARFVKIIKDAQAGQGEAVKALADEAQRRKSELEGETMVISPEALAEKGMSNTEVRNKLLATGGVQPSVQSAVESSRGKAKREIKMPFWTKLAVTASVAANLAFGGLFLYNRGRTDAVEEMRSMLGQKDNVVSVAEEDVSASAALPAGLVEGDAQAEEIIPEVGVNDAPEADVEASRAEPVEEEPTAGPEPAKDRAAQLMEEINQAILDRGGTPYWK